MVKISWHYADELKTVTVPEGTDLLSALRQGEYFLSAPCGGAGRCGKCRVRVQGALSAPTLSERSLLGEDLERGIRLACEARVLGDCEILSQRETDSRVQGLAMSRGEELLLAVDVGTTTIDARLLTRDGRSLAQGSLANPQRSYGADVISRIASVQGDPSALPAMQEQVLGAIRSLAESLCRASGSEPEQIVSCAVAGNTVMTHIFWGEDPTALGKMPFAPVFLEDRTAPAQSLALPFGEGAAVTTLPCISAFLGGDVTAGLLVCPMGPGEKLLLVDIGTNGEMVYADGETMRGCAAAAGPALEGGGISCGVAAVPGAIAHITGDAGGYAFHTVGDAQPVGLCGSGIVDAAALLLDLEILDPSGFLEEPLQAAYRDHIHGEDGSRAWQIAPGVALTQRDIRELQLTKAAIAAGIEALCGDSLPDTVYLCGGLGGAIRVESACAIDLLPPRFRDLVVPAGNTSLLGAQQIALHPEKLAAARALAVRVQALNLAELPGFQDSFAGHMAFGEW